MSDNNWISEYKMLGLSVNQRNGQQRSWAVSPSGLGRNCKRKKKKAQNHSDWKEASNHIFYSLVYLPSALKLLSRKLALTTLRSNKVSLC